MCDTMLNSICRLCLKDNFSLRSIYTYRCNSGEAIVEVLEKIYDLKICEGDGLPTKICVSCSWRVLEFDMYRKNVRHAETELRKLLSRTCNDVARDPIEVIDNESDVSIKNEIEIEEWEMPLDILPQENIENEAGEDDVKETEESAVYIFEHNYPENDGRTEELEELLSTESCDINSSDCLGQIDKSFENLPSENSSSVVSTSGISVKNKANKEMCEESVKYVLFTEEESFLSLKSKSDDNSAKLGSSSSGMAVQSKRKRFVCDICKKSFVKKWILGQHVRIHYNDRPFKCVECGKSFKQEITKIVHELAHLKKQKENGRDKEISNKKCHVCEICKKEYQTRQTLYQHSNLHKNKYLCTFCGKRCVSNYDLNKHSRIHTNEKPFSCEVCKRTFNEKGQLNRHLPTHSDDYLFQCNVCDKRFKTKQQKNQHELFHLRRK